MIRARIAHDWEKNPLRGGTAVVIDVLRFSTTLCALLKAGRRAIYVVQSPRCLPARAGLASADVFSEMDFVSPGRRFDNSPYEALRRKRSRRPAFVTTTRGSRAVWASQGSGRVLVGGFANFQKLLARLRRTRGPLHLVPAGGPRHSPEDGLCAKAFQRALEGDLRAPEKAISALKASKRLVRFRRLGRPWGGQDLRLCLKLNGLPVIPEACFNSRRGTAQVRPA